MFWYKEFCVITLIILLVVYILEKSKLLIKLEQGVVPANCLGLLVIFHLREDNPRLYRQLEIKRQSLVIKCIVFIDCT